MKKLLCVLIVMFCSGCNPFNISGPEVKQEVDWTNLHRVGPNTKAQIYFWDAENEEWFLSKERFLIPELHYIVPPPTVDER